MSKPDGKGSKPSKNKSGAVRPTVGNHDIPKVVSVDRQTEDDVDANTFNFADVSTPAAKRKKRPSAADADAFDFADVSATSSSSGNRKTGAGQRSAAASGTRSSGARGCRGRGKGKKDVELMVAYGTLGAMALVAVIGLAVMLSGGNSAKSNKSRDHRRSQTGTKYRDPSRYMQSTAEQRRLIEQRRNWSRGDVAFPDADPDADQVEPVVTGQSTTGDFQLPPPRDGTGSIGGGNKHAQQPLERSADDRPH